MQLSIGNKTSININENIFDYDNVYPLNDAYILIVENEVYSIFNAKGNLENYNSVPARTKYIIDKRLKYGRKFISLENRFDGEIDYCEDCPGIVYSRKESNKLSKNQTDLILVHEDFLEEVPYTSTRIHNVAMSAYNLFKQVKKDREDFDRNFDVIVSLLHVTAILSGFVSGLIVLRYIL